MMTKEQREQLSPEELAWYKKTYGYSMDILRERREELAYEIGTAIMGLPLLKRLAIKILFLIINISSSIKELLHRPLRRKANWRFY